MKCFENGFVSVSLYLRYMFCGSWFCLSVVLVLVVWMASNWLYKRWRINVEVSRLCEVLWAGWVLGRSFILFCFLGWVLVLEPLCFLAGLLPKFRLVFLVEFVSFG